MVIQLKLRKVNHITMQQPKKMLVESESCICLSNLLLQFFPSPVKPDGQESQEIDWLIFSLHGTPGKHVSLLQRVLMTSQCWPIKPALQLQL